MPFKDEHLRKAQHNEDFIKYLESSDSSKTKFIDWRVTALFYISIHYIEAFLATHKLHSQTHDNRDEYMEKVGLVDEEFLYSYNRLRDNARLARYSVTPIQEYKFEAMRIFYKNIKK